MLGHGDDAAADRGGAGGPEAARRARRHVHAGRGPAGTGVRTKAAALLHSIVGNHPLVDGNKRLGWLAAAVFLELDGSSVSTAANDDVHDLVMAAARGDMSVDGIATALRQM
ncbi:MAG: hypothetical protein F4046_01050 [Acidimicrobiaceae bacterium]|nr:hypothetical protein [Acidimicrobiaceae bacterium]